MVCRDCRGGYHEACGGHSWCDCQHKAESPKKDPDRKDLVILVTRTGEDGEMYCTLDREQTSP